MKDEGQGTKEVRHENLLLRTKDFSLRIIKLSQCLPDTREASVIARQVLKSGTSPGANYREAYRARSTAEFVAKIGDCLKELHETQYWLEILEEAKILPARRLQAILSECGELIAIFTTIRKNAQRSK